MKRLVFVLILLGILVYSSCPENIKELPVPAVIGENSGGLLTLEVTTLEGEGRIFTSIVPRVGSYTQASEEDAVRYAFYYTDADRDECDILFEIKNAENSKFIDGPSAGAAMAIATIAALEDKEMRNDAIISGTVNIIGDVGAVGGIAEKVDAASTYGKKLFLTKPEGVREYLMIAGLEERYDINIVEVDNIPELTEIMFNKTGTPVQENELVLETKPMPVGLPEITLDSDLQRFKQIGEDMSEEMDEKISKLKTETESNMTKQFLEHIRIDSIDLEDKIENARVCIDSLDTTEKRFDSWGWNTGADMRKNWADDKLGDVESDYHIINTEDEEYNSLYDTLYSESWCSISKSLKKDGSSILINESLLETLADRKIVEAEDFIAYSPNPSSDSLWHLEMAYKALENDEYMAAIFESGFAMAMQESSDNVLSSNKDYMNLKTKELLDEEYESLWAKLYQGQGSYLYWTEDEEGAYQLLLLADYMEGSHDEIQEMILDMGDSAADSGEETGETSVVVGNEKNIYIAIFLFLILVIAVETAYIIRQKRKKLL